MRYSKNYAIADDVIARKICTEVMRFRQGHSHSVRYSEVYVIAGVVIARSDLYKVSTALHRQISRESSHATI